jgi:hypothetical protein
VGGRRFPVIELSGYALEVLRKDEELILYRGRSKEHTSPALVVSPVGGAPHAGKSETAGLRIFS